jgi:hypothetical protein
MVVYVVQNSNVEIEFFSQQDADDYANLYDLTPPTERTKIIPELVQANKDAQLTEEDSAQMFDDYIDIIVKIKSDDLGNAVTLLESKTPSGDITQDLINTWIIIVNEYI